MYMGKSDMKILNNKRLNMHPCLTWIFSAGNCYL